MPIRALRTRLLLDSLRPNAAHAPGRTGDVLAHPSPALAARLRGDRQLAAALAEQITLLLDTSVGIAIWLLWLSGQLDTAATQSMQDIADGPERNWSWTFDPLTGQACHAQLLALDILDILHR